MELSLGRATSEKPMSYDRRALAGVSDSHKVAVLVPVVLHSEAQIQRLCANLERNYLIACDSNVLFAVLSDFEDSPEEAPSDHDMLLLNSLVDKARSINQRHATWAEFPISILHRRRSYSRTQQCWMGLERKSGKVREFNRLVCGKDAHFEWTFGFDFKPRSVSHAMILDEDTELTPNALQILYGALEHPANVSSRCSGYGVAIPATQSVCCSSWRWAEVFGGVSRNSALAVSPPRNFMQDYLGECPYPGKGMYVIDRFEERLGDGVPSECVLSHDTFEGFYLRPGYVPQALLIEEFPPSFASYAARLHRWIRGDLQNAVNLARCVGMFGAPRAAKDFYSIGAFTIFNQLLNSMSPVFLVAAFLAPLLLGMDFSSSLLVYVCITCTIISPAIIYTVSRLVALRSPARFGYKIIVIFFWRTVRSRLVHSLYAPALALLAVDAYCRTALRLISGKRLLDWVASSSKGAVLNWYSSRSIFFPLALICLFSIINNDFTECSSILNAAACVSFLLGSLLNIYFSRSARGAVDPAPMK